MSDFYEEDDELLDMEEDEFVDPTVDTNTVVEIFPKQDARRRLESLLEERRLRAELDDSFD